MKHIWRLSAVGLALVGLLAVAQRTTEASRINSSSYLTFSGPIELPGVTLPAGTYLFELPVFETPTVVRVWNRNRSKVFFTAFTNVVGRPGSLKPDEQVTFGELVRGEPARIHAWYPAEQQTGREFVYP